MLFVPYLASRKSWKLVFLPVKEIYVRSVSIDMDFSWEVLQKHFATKITEVVFFLFKK